MAYSSSVNEIITEQPDGTLAAYRGIKKESFMITVGQTVYPGTPLGLDSRYTTDGKPNISLLITYLKANNFENKVASLSDAKSFYGFITPQFCTADNAKATLMAQQNYVSDCPADVVKKEMTKKELKNFSTTHP